MGKLKSVGEASRPEIQVGVDATVLRQKLFFSTKSQVCALRPSAYREDQPDEGGSSPVQKSAACAMFPLPPRAREQHLDLCLLRCLGALQPWRWAHQTHHHVDGTFLSTTLTEPHMVTLKSNSEKRELSYTTGGKVSWYSHCGKQCGCLSENKK